ncbi:MAG: SEC-C metal-binding domain-containing protein [Acidimicrobiia bacterium]
MHAQVSVAQPAPAAVPATTNLSYSAPEDPSSAPGALGPAARAEAAALGGAEAPAETPDAEPTVNTPVVRSEWDKTPRNAPCPCGSGKKFKLCHGR